MSLAKTQPPDATINSQPAIVRGWRGWLGTWRRLRPGDKTGGSNPNGPQEPEDSKSAEERSPLSAVDQLLADDRYPLLLRPQIAETLDASAGEKATAALHDAMALVPEGVVELSTLGTSQQPDHEARNRISVEAIFLDRYTVTNWQYSRFVAAGGYEQMTLWDPEMWSAVLEFVDQTGGPGPRFWRDGRYPPGEDNHPVVGVSWYEAAAYSRWVGKRLPSDAEWVKAGAWPVTLGEGAVSQRTYPWGEDMDRRLANVWGTGLGRAAAVDEYSGGASVGGVHQLIGNVWEWTSSTPALDPVNDDAAASPPRSWKSLHGGAFDTYFDAQATCHFQSADHPLARRHNVSFRCALGVCDVYGGLAEPEAGVVAA